MFSFVFGSSSTLINTVMKPTSDFIFVSSSAVSAPSTTVSASTDPVAATANPLVNPLVDASVLDTPVIDGDTSPDTSAAPAAPASSASNSTPSKVLVYAYIASDQNSTLEANTVEKKPTEYKTVEKKFDNMSAAFDYLTTITPSCDCTKCVKKPTTTPTTSAPTTSSTATNPEATADCEDSDSDSMPALVDVDESSVDVDAADNASQHANNKLFFNSIFRKFNIFGNEDFKLHTKVNDYASLIKKLESVTNSNIIDSRIDESSNIIGYSGTVKNVPLMTKHYQLTNPLAPPNIPREFYAMQLSDYVNQAKLRNARNTEIPQLVRFDILDLLIGQQEEARINAPPGAVAYPSVIAEVMFQPYSVLKGPYAESSIYGPIVPEYMEHLINNYYKNDYAWLQVVEFTSNGYRIIKTVYSVPAAPASEPAIPANSTPLAN